MGGFEPPAAGECARYGPTATSIARSTICVASRRWAVRSANGDRDPFVGTPQHKHVAAGGRACLIARAH